MEELLKLDAVEADGEAKNSRKAEILYHMPISISSFSVQ